MRTSLLLLLCAMLALPGVARGQTPGPTRLRAAIAAHPIVTEQPRGTSVPGQSDVSSATPPLGPGPRAIASVVKVGLLILAFTKGLTPVRRP